MDDIEVTMSQKARKLPRVAYDTVRNAARQFKAGRLNTVVRNKMGDGSLGVGDDHLGSQETQEEDSGCSHARQFSGRSEIN